MAAVRDRQVLRQLAQLLLVGRFAAAGDQQLPGPLGLVPPQQGEGLQQPFEAFLRMETGEEEQARHSGLKRGKHLAQSRPGVLPQLGEADPQGQVQHRGGQPQAGEVGGFHRRCGLQGGGAIEVAPLDQGEVKPLAPGALVQAPGL